MLDHLSRLFFGICFPLLSMYCACLLRLAWIRGNASKQWPTTEGTILESRVKYDDNGYSPLLRYQYQVGSEVFAGDTITYRGFKSERSDVEAYVEKYSKHSVVLVYYDPATPGNSVLEPGVDSSSYVLGGVVIVVLFTIGISLLIFELRHFLA